MARIGTCFMSNFLSFWGKAGGAGPGDEPDKHPLAYHSLDVAAVADALLTSHPRRLLGIAQLLDTPQHAARALISGLIALHDVGKFSAAFQAKSEFAWPGELLGDRGAYAGQSLRHDELGSEMRDFLRLRTLFGGALEDWAPSARAGLWHAIAGHHGQPRVSAPVAFPRGLTSVCRQALAAFLDEVEVLFGSVPKLPELSDSQLARLSWHVAGLTTVADWIGSNREWFPYQRPERDLEAYWGYARDRAAIALRQSGLLPAPISPDISVARLMPEITALSPLQRHVAAMALPDGPSLTIIEDVTGSGKTEAAILLAGRLMTGGFANGVFFALPTMATANAMYDRLSDIYARLYADASRPSLVLAHGKRMLNDAFTDTILEIARSVDGYEDGGGAVCRAWIADDRRKVFLAEVGIGTVDQALLGVLPTRHQALRLWGLADRVLVIDEAHAYDAYMSRELETLLEFHSALGGSAIVLSATLPAVQRRNLETAFARGLGAQLGPSSETGYPLLTQVSGDGRSSQRLATRPDRARSLQVRRIASFEAAVDHVAEKAGQGAAVAWIRNAVDDVLDAADTLRHRGIEPVVLHARFAMGDRLAIEQGVRETLGRDGTPTGRRGVVVVGSQILEQSLDYDVDAMVTDLAPVDLIVQRAGRLWRHPGRTVRPLAAPELCVLAPDPTVVETRDWYRQISPRAAAVYAHHGLVWRSAKDLFERGAIVTPDGVRDLVEAVYGIENYDDVPATLIRACLDADGKRGAARSVASANLLDVWVGYGGASNIWSRDTVTPTRLGDPVTVFRLGRVENSAIVPWYPDANPARAWALSEVSLSSRKATGVPALDAAGEWQIAAAKAGWPTWEQDMPLLVLEPDGEVWRGRVERLGVSQVVGYSPVHGLGMLQVD